MPWNPVAPDGSLSVKSNRSKLGDNTTYIQTYMGNSPIGTVGNTVRDHFWNVSGNLDGRHRFIQTVGFTLGSNPANPDVGAGMDSVIYAKTMAADSNVAWFHRNKQNPSNIYQFIPAMKFGEKVIPGPNNPGDPNPYVTLTTVPNNVYGEVFLYRNNQGNFVGQTGFFKTYQSICQAWSLYLGPQGSSSEIAIKLGNGDEADGLNLRVKAESASAGNNWHYIITYRDIF